MPSSPERFDQPVDKMWCRVVMNREVRKMMRALPTAQLKALEISGTYWKDIGGFREYKTAAFPAYDVCAGPLPDQFDLVIAEQVFEHLLWPIRAGRHIFQMLKPGGHFLITTPFLLRIHNEPADCTRWSETGLRHMLGACGFPLEKIRSGSWGNRACVQANFERWEPFQPEIHSLHNEPHFPVVVWALAQKVPPAAPS